MKTKDSFITVAKFILSVFIIDALSFIIMFLFQETNVHDILCYIMPAVSILLMLSLGFISKCKMDKKAVGILSLVILVMILIGLAHYYLDIDILSLVLCNIFIVQNYLYSEIYQVIIAVILPLLYAGIFICGIKLRQKKAK